MRAWVSVYTRNSRNTAPLAAALVVFGVYLPSSLRRSAWSDDYPLLADTDLSWSLSRGQPVSGIVQLIGFGSADGIDDLRFLRIFGLLGTAVLIWWIARFLITNGLSAISAALIAATAGFLPSFHFAASWATTFPASWQCLLGAISGILWVDAEGDRQRRHQLQAVLLMTAMLLSYPPAAMFCWAVLSIRLSLIRCNTKVAIRQMVSMGVLIAISTILSLLTVGLIAQLTDIGDPNQFRFVSSGSQAVRKLVWFVSHPVVVGARPFSTLSPSALSAAVTGGPVLALIAIGIYLRAKGSISDRFILVAVVGGSAALTMTSHLVAADNQIEYRFMTGLTVSMWILLVLAVKSVVFALPIRPNLHRHLRTLGVCFLLVTTVLVAATTRSSVNRLFLEPFNSKDHYLRARLTDFDEDRHLRIVVVHPQIWPSHPRLGVFSTVTDLSHPWVIEPNIRLLLREQGVAAETLEILIVDDFPTLEKTDLSLDLRPYVQQLG